MQPLAEFRQRLHFFMKKLLIFIISVFVCSPLLAAEGKRYISLAPSTTEILFSLGLDKEIVGVSSFCNYPPQAKSKDKIGTFSQPNIEKILSLKPDYIFSTGLEQAQAVSQLKRLGLPIYVADPVNMEELIATIIEIGAITGRQVQAQQLAQKIEDKVSEISLKVKSVPADKRPKVYIEIWHDPLTTAGQGSFVNDIISIAGGVNIAFDTKRPYSIFSPEEVIKRDPDYIFLAYMGQAPQKELEKRFGWQKIKAVKNKKVYSDIDPNILLRPGPRAIEGLESVYKKLYQQ